MASLRDQIASWNYGDSKAKTEPQAPAAPLNSAPSSPAPAQQALKAEPTAEKPDADHGVAGRGHSASFYGLKTKLHQKLLTRIDLAAAEMLSADQLKAQLRELVSGLIDEDSLPVNEHERSMLVSELQHEILGLGPIEPLLADPTISEIMINGFDTIFVERKGKIQLTGIRFNDDAHLLKMIDKIVSRVGRRIDESSPMADARLPDGSRVNAIIPPLALDGPAVSIRRFAVVPLKMQDLIDKKALTASMAELLAGMVKAKTNIIISGGTGSGKTTLLNILSSYIPEDERIITIEDTAELQLQQSHVVRLETRPPNIEGKGEISMRGLVKNSLRMRPDRVVLGEVRGGEVIDMLQAMNTGHDGSLTTIHANTPRDALGRLENLVGMGGVNLPAKALRQQIASAIHVIVQATRLSDGSRKITSVQEITGMEGDIITSQEIFFFDRTGVNPDGSVQGRFRATGVRPVIAEKLKTYGINLGEELFDPNRSLD
jgi:pilus assembly protein CpaF